MIAAPAGRQGRPGRGQGAVRIPARPHCRQEPGSGGRPAWPVEKWRTGPPAELKAYHRRPGSGSHRCSHATPAMMVSLPVSGRAAGTVATGTPGMRQERRHPHPIRRPAEPPCPVPGEVQSDAIRAFQWISRFIGHREQRRFRQRDRPTRTRSRFSAPGSILGAVGTSRPCQYHDSRSGHPLSHLLPSTATPARTRGRTVFRPPRG